jgi:shikimate dehydrogenase
VAATAATGSTPSLAASRSPLATTELEALRPGTLVYDLIYTPRPTPLLQDTAARGCRTQDGLEMLVQQGAAALQLWLQAAGQALPVPVDAMREAATAWLAAPTVGGPGPG